MEATTVLDNVKHYPVLLKEIISVITPQRGGTFIDCTLGNGGYTKEILKIKNTKIIGLDRDINTEIIGKKIQENLIKELQKRPRTITHGDARGNNIFKSSDGRTIGIIDWQMWAAGPASNEFSQLWFNSYSLESGMIHKLNELTHIYYDSLTGSNSEIKNSYPFEQLLDDTKLIFINMWIQYIGFTLGSIEGYKDPELKKSKDNWREMMKRNMETVHYSGCLESFEKFIAQSKL